MDPQNDSAPQIRTDPLTGRRVIIAPERAARPSDLDRPYAAAVCPFCPGHEAETPKELLEVPGLDGVGWSARVVPNKFPALRPLAELGAVSPDSADDFPPSQPGVGQHEVIIESPAHVRCLTDLSESAVALALRVYRDRLRAQAAEPHLAYAQVFKNVGERAGASLEHTHAQLIALPEVPALVRRELSEAEEFHRRRGRCRYCAWLEGELADGRRVVLGSPRFVALAAFAGRFPFELCLLPRDHASRFEDLTDADSEDLARVLRTCLHRLTVVAGRPDYNLLVRTAPPREPARPDYHWHLEILPRLTRLAGFEWATGWMINPLPPEEAAALLGAVVS